MAQAERDAYLAPLVDAVLRVADEDDAMSVLTSVPDGWAKLDGRWVRVAHAPGYVVTGPSGTIDAAQVLVALSDAAVAGPGHVEDVPVSASEPNPPKAGR